MEQQLEEYKKQLQIKKTGANAHTANKACMYLSQISDKPKAKFSNCTRDEFLEKVRGAIYHDNWDSLSNIMSSWW